MSEMTCRKCNGRMPRNETVGPGGGWRCLDCGAIVTDADVRAAERPNLASAIARREVERAAERCDLCGKLKNGQRTECQAGVDWNMGGMQACDGSNIPMPDGTGSEIVREALRARLLRAALAEALDAWQRFDAERQNLPPVMERVDLGIDNWTVRSRPMPVSEVPRIAELRAKHLGGGK